MLPSKSFLLVSIEGRYVELKNIAHISATENNKESFLLMSNPGLQGVQFIAVTEGPRLME